MSRTSGPALARTWTAARRKAHAAKVRAAHRAGRYAKQPAKLAASWHARTAGRDALMRENYGPDRSAWPEWPRVADVIAAMVEQEAEAKAIATAAKLRAMGSEPGTDAPARAVDVSYGNHKGRGRTLNAPGPVHPLAALWRVPLVPYRDVRSDPRFCRDPVAERIAVDGAPPFLFHGA